METGAAAWPPKTDSERGGTAAAGGRETERGLWLYAWMSRFARLDYRGKIMLVACLGTHVPLFALLLYFVIEYDHELPKLLSILAVALVATLLGAIATLIGVNALLQPMLKTSAALRDYRERNALPQLPTGYTDEAGVLMSDAQHSIRDLDASLERVKHLDETTGLPNRGRFLRLLVDQVAVGAPFSVVVLHIDNLDRISDSLGDETADEVLLQLSRRLIGEVDLRMLVSRVGTAEFACVVPIDGTPQGHWVQRESVLRQARRRLEAPMVMANPAGLPIEPAIQIGVASYPNDADRAAVLLAHAVGAANDEESIAEAGVNFYSSRVREAARQRFLLEQQMRRALERNEFEVHYQPVVDVRTSRVVGAEALIRWHHPDRGLMLPGAFIQVAESSGLIEQIGMWVLEQGCRQLVDWKARGHDSIWLSVNLSARQFRDRNLERKLLELIRSYRISPHLLELELTESAAMADLDYTRKILDSLREEGMTVALDDFGTGYASMRYLRTLPFDKLKIDREFVFNVQATPQSQAICNAVLELASGLGMQVQAEGAESGDEVAYLSARGYDLFQGFFFASPIPARDFEAILARPTVTRPVFDLASRSADIRSA